MSEAAPTAPGPAPGPGPALDPVTLSGTGRAERDAVRRVVRRLALLSGAVVLAAVVLAAAAVALVYQQAGDAETAAQLREAAARSADPADVPPGTYLVVRAPDGSVRSTPDLPAGLPDAGAISAVAGGSAPQQSDVDLDVGTGDDRSYVVRTTREGDLVVQVVVDRTQTEEARERLLAALAVAVLVGAALAAVGAALVARRAARPLVSTIELQRRFVADASHELRTPLTLISTRAQLLARRLRGQEVDPATTRDVEGLVRDVGVLSGILDDLLLAARPAGERAEERVDLGPLVEGAADAARPHAATLGVHVVVHLDGDGYGDGDGERTDDRAAPGRPVVLGVPSALRRAVLALVDGAVDHASARVDVRLGVERDGRDGWAVVRVVDDGPGLPTDPGERELLFARFHRGRAARRSTIGDGHRPHHGIGLALVAEVVDAHGGRVRAGDRADGRPGALFELRLPLA